MNTLKGVFGDTKPKYKRNFIQENMKQLREMQGYWQNKEKQTNLTVTRPSNKYQNVPSRVGSRINGSQSRNSEHPSQDKPSGISKSTSKTLNTNTTNNEVSHVTQVGITRKSRSPSQRSRTKMKGTSEKDELLVSENVLTTDSSPTGGRTSRSLGCQTIDPRNTNDLHEGVIRYPSSRKLPSPKRKQLVKRPPTREMGLQTERSPSPVVTNAAAGDTPTLNDNTQCNSDLDEPSEVPETNLRSARSRTRTPPQTTNNPLKAPPTYQKGVIPKYLQERKEELQKEAEQQIRDAPDPACPPGHVTLPDNQRIETLKRLRKSYADLVQELNMMPVRTDTLRMRNRKMELEKQLNKIEQGIKLFSRPKVFVKIDA